MNVSKKSEISNRSHEEKDKDNSYKKNNIIRQSLIEQEMKDSILNNKLIFND